MNDSEHPTGAGAFQRGIMLVERDRPSDAVPYFQQAIAADPQHAMAYAQLAMCWKQMPATKAASLDAIDRAIAIDPEEPLFRGFKALILADTARDGDKTPVKAALAEAMEAVNQDPETAFYHAIAGYCHLQLRNLPQAEMCARLALEMDPEESLANQVLAGALLVQNKHADNADLVAYQLERNPEDPATRIAAGFADLMQGRHKQANEHFREALRLDPENEAARHGLVESFRARNVVYRTHLQFSHWMNQFTEGKQTAIMIGGFIAYKLLSKALAAVHPVAGGTVVGIWLVFIFWSYLARGIGGFFMLFDRYARLCLSPKEFWEGALVGGLSMVTPVLLASAIFVPDALIQALGSFFTAIALALAFTTQHYWGKKLYWGIAGVVSLCFLLGFLSFVPGLAAVGNLAAFGGILIAVAASWLATFNVGR